MRECCRGAAQGKYPAAFVSKLSDAETEAAETQVWLQFSVKCNYLDKTKAKQLDRDYDAVIAMLVNMSRQSDKWSFK